jgi:hypothetical protein
MQQEEVQYEYAEDEGVVAAIRAKIESLKNQAEALVADYWVYVEESNEALRAEKKRGNRVKEKAINFGPRVEYRKSGQHTKYVPNWVHYPYNPKRFKSEKVARMGVRVSPTSNKEYRMATLLKYSTGADDSKIVSTEKKMMVLREQLEMYHEMLVSMDRREKRVKRITEKYEVESNG